MHQPIAATAHARRRRGDDGRARRAEAACRREGDAGRPHSDVIARGGCCPRPSRREDAAAQFWGREPMSSRRTMKRRGDATPRRCSPRHIASSSGELRRAELRRDGRSCNPRTSHEATVRKPTGGCIAFGQRENRSSKEVEHQPGQRRRAFDGQHIISGSDDASRGHLLPAHRRGAAPRGAARQPARARPSRTPSRSSRQRRRRPGATPSRTTQASVCAWRCCPTASASKARTTPPARLPRPRAESSKSFLRHHATRPRRSPPPARPPARSGRSPRSSPPPSARRAGRRPHKIARRCTP